MVREICEECNNYYCDDKSFLCSICFENVFLDKYLCNHCIINNYNNIHFVNRCFVVCDNCYNKNIKKSN